MCPICRKNGGLIPVYKDDKPLKNIHYTSSYIKEKLIIINPNKLAHECGIKFFTSNNFCKSIGDSDFSGFCKKHMKYHELYVQTHGINNNNLQMNNTINDNTIGDNIVSDNTLNNTQNNILLINPNKLAHECGVKFKSKPGYCICIGKQLYGGYCGIHKSKNINLVNEM
jgi:hypothetical protein